ncbi:DUF5615 family PIN-like protein [Larkinella punicea]|uniref:DUF5615 domain-containing protein n=1 Tax=Larkinella punicea TaxID=2315727 RepID=A0A368JR02_9BACT|nr:DUF5615 family PIN-like protein [Larkinella punicea]RCR69013.1 hypothetical protein DUE52_14095 [Larkinella punicea]
MPTYLLDVNHPYYFSLWRNELYTHQRDIDDEMSDTEIWEYAKTNSLTIITKDTDFFNRILFKEPPPRIIWIGFGNLKMRHFHERIMACWPAVCELSKQNKLVKVYLDRLEAIQ